MYHIMVVAKYSFAQGGPGKNFRTSFSDQQYMHTTATPETILYTTDNTVTVPNKYIAQRRSRNYRSRVTIRLPPPSNAQNTTKRKALKQPNSTTPPKHRVFCREAYLSSSFYSVVPLFHPDPLPRESSGKT